MPDQTSHPPGLARSRVASRHAVRTGGLLLGVMALAAAVGYLLLGGVGIAIGAFAIVLLASGAQLPPHLAMRVQGATRLRPWELPGLHYLVAGLAERAGVPSPQLYLVPSPEANALTVGSAATGGALAVTEGALGLLSHDELEAVLAHEVAHLRNGDTTLLRLAGATSQAMTVLLTVSLWLALPVVLVGGLSARSMLVIAALAIVAPAAVTLLVAALSRTRELAADADAAALTGKPLALASALRKLERQRRGWFGPFFLGRPEVPELLRSHPSTELRVDRLRALAPTRTRWSPSDRLARRPVLRPRSLFPVWPGR